MFRDRIDAGDRLAAVLRDRAPHWHDPVVLGIPRGGVVVAARVADALGLPLDVVAASKIGAPQNPEYAVGSVAPDGVVLPNPHAGYSLGELEAFAAPVRQRTDARLAAFRGGADEPDVRDRTVVVIDDGIATGLTAHGAADYLRRMGATEIVLAVPVMPARTVEEAAEWADEVVTVEAPHRFSAVGQFYDDFRPTADREVASLLARSRERSHAHI